MTTVRTPLIPGSGSLAYRRPRATPTSHKTWAGAIMASMLLLTVLQPWMTYKPAPFTGEGSPLRQICYFALFPIAIWSVGAFQNPRRIFAVPAAMVVALAWCWFTIQWSAHPEIAVRRLLLTTLVIWTIFLAVSDLGYQRTIAIMRAVLVASLAASFLAVILFPQFGIHQLVHDWDTMSDPDLAGDWRGIMLQKNFAGAVCAFTIIAFFFDGSRMRGYARWGVMFSALFFLIMTGSKTSLGLTIFAISMGLLFRKYNPAYRSLIIPATMMVLIVIVLTGVIYWQTIVAPLNDRSAFTGRTQIWASLLDFHRDHPVMGAGYGSFWNVGIAESPMFRYTKGWVTGLAQGHNGYLDLLVTIGLPGVLLVVFAVVLVPIGRLLASSSIPRDAGALLLAMVIFGAGHNLTESSLFDRDAIVQSFLMVTVAMIYAATRSPVVRLPGRSRVPRVRTFGIDGP